MPIGHLGINVSDLPRSKAYYDALLPRLDYEPFLAGDDQFAYRPAAGKMGTYVFFYPSLETSEYSRHRTGLQHLAFMVRTRAEVDSIHNLVQELGSEVIETPREFDEYPGPYYATFWYDPDGVMLEAVCHKNT